MWITTVRASSYRRQQPGLEAKISSHGMRVVFGADSGGTNSRLAWPIIAIPVSKCIKVSQ